MALHPIWRPDTRALDAEENVAGGIHTAAIEVSTLSLEAELRHAFDLLGVRASDIEAIFDQARYDALLIDIEQTPFSARHRAALMIRQSLRAALKARGYYR